MLLGIDVSTYFDEQAENAKYFLDGKEIDPLKVFKEQGVSHMRIRVWNRPYSDEGEPYLGGTNDVETFLRLSKLGTSYGYKIILDFHYSDFWVDPGKQTCPKDWKDLPFETLLEKVEEFTYSTMQKAKEVGIDIDFVQIGNEITNGIIWPYGKIDDSVTPRGNFDHLSMILKAGIKGAKKAYPNVRTIIHLENSSNQAIYQNYFDNLEHYGVDYDVIGMSYYPYWHGNFDTFFQNVEMCKSRYHKDVMVMELGYAFTLEDYILNNNGMTHLVVNSDLEVLKNLMYPLSKEGQAAFIKDFISEGEKHGLLGINYWEPLWIPKDEKICWSSKAGQKYIKEEGKSTRNEWCNQCLFDYEGNALPSFKNYRIGDHHE
ncbi:MAG: glycosyl hydrolase 53 family protein [Bacilli bacterium]|nr:glycosyl hydrolase 53 family protein [Bacilli bacterium]